MGRRATRVLIRSSRAGVAGGSRKGIPLLHPRARQRRSRGENEERETPRFIINAPKLGSLPSPRRSLRYLSSRKRRRINVRAFYLNIRLSFCLNFYFDISNIKDDVENKILILLLILKM